MIYQEKKYESIRYLQRLPKFYIEGTKLPTILFLHGAGTVGTDIEVLKNNSFFVSTDKPDCPFAVVAPLCEQGVWFDVFEQLKAFAEAVSEMQFVDQDRLYLIGNSMGGYGAWQLAMSLPHLFAALVPVCGGGMAWRTKQLKNVPIWAFHGQLDDTVFVDESIHMVDETNRHGGNARLTIFPNADHNSWDPTYATEELWLWLLSQKRKKSSTVIQERMDPTIYG